MPRDAHDEACPILHDTAHRTGPWPRAAASAVLFRGESVLLVERGSDPDAGHWSLPGGTIEAGETAEEAARREAHEETGLYGHMEGLAGVYDVIDRDDNGNVVLHYVIACYFGSAVDGQPRPASDVRQAEFVALDKLQDLRLTNGTRCVIEKAWQLLAADVAQAVAKASERE
ncbi:ADP-ribose pyrophosphatase [Hyphomicrobium sulfonivorans]|uniref:ADP-ribose pyrophosphatase n=1 Tax=Hyphomicrobium sulfonivorans TaxID=121290 RepID=A0A109BAL6_HYPSL|nr:NUDIX domain-containing protein [Hyphomicrobium sulfonivorans]KWT64712.1 ADP-ribose pyrophosphatase [Hyphomicrobium sulfonivorans]